MQRKAKKDLQDWHDHMIELRERTAVFNAKNSIPVPPCEQSPIPSSNVPRTTNSFDLSYERRIADALYGTANKQMQRMLLAAEKAEKCVGKTSIFGKDKFEPAYKAFQERLNELFHVLNRRKLPPVALADVWRRV